MKEKAQSMPRSVQKRIMRRWAAGERPLVVTGHGKKPTKVYGYDEYHKMVAHPQHHKPWEQRQAKRVPDPLGAIDGTVLVPITRAVIYEDSDRSQKQSSVTPAERDYGKQLLRDLKSVCGVRKGISTAKALRLLWRRPMWQSFGGGKLNAQDMANLLRPFGLTPKPFRRHKRPGPKSGDVVRGYLRHDIETAARNARVEG